MVGRGVRHTGWRFARWIKQHNNLIVPVTAVLTVLLTMTAYWILPPRSAEPEADQPRRERAPLAVVPELSPVRQTEQVKDIDDYRFVFTKPPSTLTRPERPLDPEQDPEPTYEWAYDNGGADIDQTRLELSVVGRRTEAVILTDFRVRVERRPPLAGHLVTWKSTPSGDALPGRWIHVDLDRTPPRITLSVQPGGKQWSFPLRVSSAEPEYFYIYAFTTTCGCSWTAELHYVADGKKGVYRIDNNGKPFRTTTTANVVGRYLTSDGRRFAKAAEHG